MAFRGPLSTPGISHALDHPSPFPHAVSGLPRSLSFFYAWDLGQSGGNSLPQPSCGVLG